ncbi:hypothetical protein EYF80_023252 [Liparis tanakae]|uniref:Uncharacterized protein n=1 Tax=Liparis tanakae TaxID=230148 RepID=A0A4Z2HL78_9TELE|nr:hypothetical protein EYF80_023252 [Liparis tanakae]
MARAAHVLATCHVHMRSHTTSSSPELRDSKRVARRARLSVKVPAVPRGPVRQSVVVVGTLAAGSEVVDGCGGQLWSGTQRKRYPPCKVVEVKARP